MKRLLFILIIPISFIFFSLPAFAQELFTYQSGNGSTPWNVRVESNNPPYELFKPCYYYNSAARTSYICFRVPAGSSTYRAFNFYVSVNGGNYSQYTSYSWNPVNNYITVDGVRYQFIQCSIPGYNEPQGIPYPQVLNLDDAYTYTSTLSDYDPDIALDMEAWTVLDYDIDHLTTNFLNCGAYFKSSDADHVDIYISGSKKSDTFTIAGNYGAKWFQMSDYADPLGTVVICFTPYDASGNWGNTLVIEQGYKDLSKIKQAFTGYTHKVTNSGGTTDIIGIDDPTVITVPDKPNNAPPTVTNPLKTTTVYVPVFQGSPNTSVINNYIDNSQVVTNNYYTTNNYIDKSTSINININTGDLQSGAPGRWNIAKGFLDEKPDEAFSALSAFSGTPLQPILVTLISCFGVLVAAALVFVIVKIVGLIL